MYQIDHTESVYKSYFREVSETVVQPSVPCSIFGYSGGLKTCNDRSISTSRLKLNKPVHKRVYNDKVLAVSAKLTSLLRVAWNTYSVFPAQKEYNGHFTVSLSLYIPPHMLVTRLSRADVSS